MVEIDKRRGVGVCGREIESWEYLGDVIRVMCRHVLGFVNGYKFKNCVF